MKYDRAYFQPSVDYIKSKLGGFEPKLGLILGSGLGTLADEIDAVCTVDYNDLEGFPVSTVEGHKGRFVFGNIGDVKVVIMQGRVHYYEGYAMQEVVMPVRVMAGLGAKILFITNASGGMNTSFKAGDLMLITDQISSFVPSPLAGPNAEELGERFPDMSEIYDRQLKERIRAAADRLGISLREGIYLQASGPNFESPAEIRFFSGIGADAVGMSTAVEAIAARHAGMRVGGISLISNPAAGLSKTPLTHEEVQEAADMASHKFSQLISSIIKEIGGIN